MDEDPQTVLENLEDTDDDECLYIDRDDPNDAYLWPLTEEDDDGYALLERSRRGTWIQPRPISPDGAVNYLERVSDDVAVEVRPQTGLPPKRHPVDKI